MSVISETAGMVPYTRFIHFCMPMHPIVVLGLQSLVVCIVIIADRGVSRAYKGQTFVSKSAGLGSARIFRVINIPHCVCLHL